MKPETYNSLPIILPKVVSRPVQFNFKDLWCVVRTSWKIKWAMLRPFPGKYPFAASIGHSQIEPNDPMRFFVLDRENNHIKLKKFFGARTIINPVITWHGNVKLKSFEGCMSYPNTKQRPIKRYEKVECEYWTIFGKKKRTFYMFRACVLQHEIDHFDCINIQELWKHKKDK